MRLFKKFGEITDALMAVPAIFMGAALVIVGVRDSKWDWWMLLGIGFIVLGIIFSYEFLQKLGVIRRKS